MQSFDSIVSTFYYLPRKTGKFPLVLALQCNKHFYNRNRTYNNLTWMEVHLFLCITFKFSLGYNTL